MKKKTLFNRIFTSIAAIVLLSLVALTAYASHVFHQFYLRQTEDDLKARAHLAAEIFHDRLSAGNTDSIDFDCKKLGARDPMRITVILNTGEVIGDSEQNPDQMDDHGNRPEVLEALREETGSAIRFSDTLQRDMMYVAIAVRGEGQPVGLVRTSVSLSFIDQVLAGLYHKIVIVGLLAALLAGAVSVAVSRHISCPLQELREGAERFARGNLERKLPLSSFQEISELAGSMNDMAAQLNERIRTEVEQRNQLEAVLSSMVEGVLAVDRDDRIISLNEAAGRLLSIDPEKARGQRLREAVRNPDLQRIIGDTLAGNQPVEDEIEIQQERPVLLRAHGTTLRDAEGRSAGALVVLHDLTRLRRLENVRTDFVANVSHELKTPLTSMKGFAETLLAEGDENPEERKRFLKIIASHTDRLHAIVEDLLSLSQLEEDSAKGEISLQEHNLADILENAVNSRDRIAAAKNISVHLTCADDLKVRANPNLLEQAVVNLLDNAVKYSEVGKSIRIEAEAEGGEVVIRVRDEAGGIEAEHLPRLFERFYRVDKARSRELGGTGLGLSIVKHIAIAHHGRVAVESKLGKGSVFTIHLPAS